MANPFPFVAGNVLTAAEMNGIGEWTSYTPVLTATVTNPTLGTAATATGSYARIQNLIIANFEFFFGTSGFSAGSGDYRVSLPVTASAVSLFYGASIGQTSFYDSSTNIPYYCDAWLGSTTQAFILFQPTLNGVINTLSNVNPVVPANSDGLTGLLIYRAA